jgi:hypothetical protein
MVHRYDCLYIAPRKGREKPYESPENKGKSVLPLTSGHCKFVKDVKGFRGRQISQSCKLL